MVDISMKAKKFLLRIMVLPFIQERLQKVSPIKETQFVHLALCYHLIAKVLIHMRLEKEGRETDFGEAVLAALIMVENGEARFEEDENGVVRAVLISK